MESETVCLNQDTSNKEQATVIVIIKQQLGSLNFKLILKTLRKIN